VTRSGYDGAGRLVQSSDARVYDALNRVTSATTSGPGTGGTAQTTTTAYDQDGNAIQTQAPNGTLTLTQYDLAGDAVEVDEQANGVTTLYVKTAYDAAGNAVQSTDADGRTTTTTYDPDNRVVQTVSTVGGSTVTTAYAYDPDGNTLSTTTTDGTGTHTQTATFDAEDRQTSVTDDGATTTYGYDAAGQRRTETLPGGATTLTYGVDPQGRMTAVTATTSGAGSATTSYGYTANDQLARVALPGGVAETAQYDANGRLTVWHDPGPGQNVTYAYGYDAAGRTTSASAVSGTDTLGYDGQGRLAREAGPQVETPTKQAAWTYDAAGNLLTQVGDNGGTVTYSYAGAALANELRTLSASGLTTTYGYDGAGNTTSLVNNATLTRDKIDTHLSYDAQARPVTVTRVDATGVRTTVTMAYNAGGERARYTASMSGTVTADYRFAYAGGELARVTALTATLNADGSVKSSGGYTDSFVYGATGTPVEFVRTTGGGTTPYWYETDGRGSVVAVTDQSGAVVDQYAYDSWGETVGKDTQAVPQQLRYRGYWYDGELTWEWVAGRDYDPESARYLQPVGDPSFVYAKDNPMDASNRAKPCHRCAITLHFEPLADEPDSYKTIWLLDKRSC